VEKCRKTLTVKASNTFYFRDRKKSLFSLAKWSKTAPSKIIFPSGFGTAIFLFVAFCLESQQIKSRNTNCFAGTNGTGDSKKRR